MTAPVAGWGPRFVVRGCARCGSAFKVERTSPRWYCTTGCLQFIQEERRERINERQRERYNRSIWEHREEIRTTPLHELYPGMLEVCERVQTWRRSYPVWLEARR